MKFYDRFAAGKLLGEAIFDEFGTFDVVVLALPRGGIPVSLEVAKRLSAEFGIVEVKKIGAPDNSELAIGAVGPKNDHFLDKEIIETLGVSKEYLRKEIAKKSEEAREREKFYSRLVKPVEITGKTVILVDDGLATGTTVQAAARIIEEERPKKKILAVPVAPPSSIKKVQEDFDEVIALFQPWDFRAVGQYYQNFKPLSDEEIKEMIEKYLK